MRSKHSLFIRLLLSFAVLIAVIVGLGSISYVVTISTLKKNQVRELEASLQHASDLFDLRLSEIDSLIVQISENELTKTIIKLAAPLQPPEYYHLYKIGEYFPQYIWTNSFITELIVYYSNADVIATSGQVTARSRLFYDNLLSFGSRSFDEWRESILTQPQFGRLMPEEDIRIYGVWSRCITYCSTLQKAYSSKPYGAVVAVINEESLNDIFSGVAVGEEGWFSIQDHSGEVLFSSRKGPNASGDGITVTSEAGDSNITFSAFAPTASFSQPVRSFIRLYLATSGSVVLLGLVLAFALSYANALPMRKLIRHLKGRSAVGWIGNEYDFLEEFFAEVVTTNKSLRSSIAEHATLLEHAFIEKVIRGHYVSSSDLIEDFIHLGKLRKRLEGKSYRAILLRFSDERSEELVVHSDEIDVIRALVIRVLKKYATSDDVILNVAHDRIVIVSVLPADVAGIHSRETRAGCDFIEKTYIEMKASYAICLSFGVGRICSSLIDLSLSYLDASAALESGSYSLGKFVVWYSEVENRQHPFAYTIEDENKLTQLILTGDREGACSIVNRGFWQLLNDGDRDGIAMLMSGIKITLLRVRSKLDIESQMQQEFDEIVGTLEWDDSLEKALDATDAAIGMLCKHIESQKRSHNKVVVEKAIEYLENTYSNPSVNLDLVAMELGLTANYLSKLFKEQAGISFSRFLEDARMRAAETLITKGHIHISAVAKRCGYGTLSTFYRAFKKRYGVSPGKYQVKTREITTDAKS